MQKNQRREVYKIINQKYDISSAVALEFIKNSKERGNKYKFNKKHCKYDLRKYFLTNRIVALLEQFAWLCCGCRQYKYI